MDTVTKTLSEQLKIHPWQLEARGQNIMARKNGGRWPEGTRHYLYSIQRVGFGTPEPHFFEYSQGPAHTKAPSLADLMYALLTDARVVEDCKDEWEMANEYGYEVDSKESHRRLQEVYRTCEDVHGWMNRTFSREELEQLYAMFEDY